MSEAPDETPRWIELLVAEVAATQPDHLPRGRLAFVLAAKVHELGGDGPEVWGRLYVACPICGHQDGMLACPDAAWVKGDLVHYCDRCDSKLVYHDLVLDPEWVRELVACRVEPGERAQAADLVNREWIAGLPVPAQGPLVTDPAQLWPPPRVPVVPLRAEPAREASPLVPPAVRCLAELALTGEDRRAICDGRPDPWAVPLFEMCTYENGPDGYCAACLHEVARRSSAAALALEARESALLKARYR
jgi:hypothetical protein